MDSPIDLNNNKKPDRKIQVNRKSGKAPFIRDSDFEFAFEGCSGKHKLRDQLCLLVSHKMGLRAMEIANLKMRDIFDVQWQIHDTIRLLSGYTKGGKFRETFVENERLKHLLYEYLSERKSSSYGARHQDALIVSQKEDNPGRHFTANTMQKLIGRIYKQAGVRASSHSGRRNFATKLINSGASIFDVQQLMGHSSITTTQVYFSESSERLKKVIANI